MGVDPVGAGASGSALGCSGLLSSAANGWLRRMEGNQMADYRRIMTLLLQQRPYRRIEVMAGCSHRAIARAAGC